MWQVIILLSPQRRVSNLLAQTKMVLRLMYVDVVVVSPFGLVVTLSSRLVMRISKR